MPTIHRALLPTLLTIAVAALFVVACGGGSETPTIEAGENADPVASVGLPLWRYVNSGWVSPVNEQPANAFSKEFRVAVITSAEEMDEFNRVVIGKRTNGTSTSLSRPEFPGSVVLVAYVMWLPVQGDPLSVVGLEIEGNKAVVELELDEDSQGREYPYLYAPMTMVTIDRSVFPDDGPIEFEFRLGDEAVATVTDSLD